MTIHAPPVPFAEQLAFLNTPDAERTLPLVMVRRNEDPRQVMCFIAGGVRVNVTRQHDPERLVISGSDVSVVEGGTLFSSRLLRALHLPDTLPSALKMAGIWLTGPGSAGTNAGGFPLITCRHAGGEEWFILTAHGPLLAVTQTAGGDEEPEYRSNLDLPAALDQMRTQREQAA